MILKDFLPGEALRAFVQCYRIVHFESGSSDEMLMKAYPPKPEQCLHFVLRGSLDIKLPGVDQKVKQLPISLLGQQTSVTPRYNRGNLLNFQIVFQPAAIYRLTGIPADQFTNRNINAEDIFSTEIFNVYEALQQAENYGEMLAVGERFVTKLVQRAKKDQHPLDRVIQLMMKEKGNVSLDWLARESYLCTRQFKRKFNERVGVGPKFYSRNIRFIHAFNTRNAHQDWDWLSIAMACHYFDYQHLARDYTLFTGLNPHRFHLQEMNSPECKLGLSAELYRDRFNFMPAMA